MEDFSYTKRLIREEMESPAELADETVIDALRSQLEIATRRNEELKRHLSEQARRMVRLEILAGVA